MILSEKETTVIKDLQTQEQCCVEKYERYSKLAKDQVLIDLFTDCLLYTSHWSSPPNSMLQPYFWYKV